MQASDPLIPLDPYPYHPTCCERFALCLASIVEKIVEVFKRFINWIKSLCAPSKIDSPITQTPIGGLSIRKKTPSPTGSDHLYDNDITVNAISQEDLDDVKNMSSTPTPPINYYPLGKPPKTPSPDSTRSLDSWVVTDINKSPAS